MATTTVSSKGQVVIPRHLREKHRLTPGVRFQIIETEEGLVLSPVGQPNAAISGPVRMASTPRIGEGDRCIETAPRGTPA